MNKVGGLPLTLFAYAYVYHRTIQRSSSVFYSACLQLAVFQAIMTNETKMLTIVTTPGSARGRLPVPHSRKAAPSARQVL